MVRVGGSSGTGAGRVGRRRRGWLALPLIALLLAACAGAGTPVPPTAPSQALATTTATDLAPTPRAPTATPPTAARVATSASTPRPTVTATSTRRPATIPTGPTPTPLVVSNPSKLTQVSLDGQAVPLLAIGGKDNQTIFASAKKGLQRSTDGGKTWQIVRDEKQVPHLSALVIAPSNPQAVYVGTNDGCNKAGKQPGFASSDGGATWREFGDGLVAIAVDPKNSQQIYAVDCDGLKRSKDGGATWTTPEGAAISGGGATFIAVAPAKPEIVYLAVSVGTPKLLILRSLDRGATWQGVTPAIEGGRGAGQALPGQPKNVASAQPLALAVDATKPTSVLISTSHGVFRTEDSGDNWTLLDGGLEGTAAPSESATTSTRLTSALLADPAKSGTFWVGTGADKLKGVGLFRTRDSGATWRKPTGGLENKGILALALGGTATSPILYIATDDGLWSLTAP